MEPPTRWNPYDKTKTGKELFHYVPEAPEPHGIMNIEQGIQLGRWYVRPVVVDLVQD